MGECSRSRSSYSRNSDKRSTLEPLKLRLILGALIAFAVVVVPAAARTHTEPFFVGGVADDAFGGHIWFNYAAGREARHITAGTYYVEIQDQSNTHNFHLRDLTWGGTHLDMTTTPAFNGNVYWTVTFEATQEQNGDYEFLSD